MGFVRNIASLVSEILFIQLLFCILYQLGSTAIGLKTKEGVVLAVEKRVTSPLLVLERPLFSYIILTIGIVNHRIHSSLALTLIILLVLVSSNNQFYLESNK